MYESRRLYKSNNENLIKFNSGNELAIDLFSKNLINFAQINNIIDKSLSINVKSLFSIIHWSGYIQNSKTQIPNFAERR